MVPPLVDAANALGLAWTRAKDDGRDPTDARRWIWPHYSSEWLVIARRPAYLEHLKDTGTIRWTVPPATGEHLWRDGGKHDLEPLRWAKAKTP
jgi:hypothetical protein